MEGIYYFNVALKYDKLDERGVYKKVTEHYLVKSFTCSSAEYSIIQKVQPFITGDFKVNAVKESKYSELFLSEEAAADRYFECKLKFITLDEKSGKEKFTQTKMLVQAADLRDAVKKLDSGMKGTMAEYQIVSVSETNIMDIFTEENIEHEG
jgi:hypothetical protein